MAAVLKILAMIVQFMPTIVGLIHAAESILPQAGTGPAKMALVLGGLESAAVSVGKTAEEIAALRDPLTHVVNSVVATFNSFKVWPSPVEPAAGG